MKNEGMTVDRPLLYHSSRRRRRPEGKPSSSKQRLWLLPIGHPSANVISKQHGSMSVCRDWAEERRRENDLWAVAAYDEQSGKLTARTLGRGRHKSHLS